MEPIRYYVNGAFQGVAESPEMLEQQEELVADLTAKVSDLVGQGKSEEEALGLAIGSVGDLSALVAEFDTGERALPIPTATVYSNRLDLHVVAFSSAVGAAVMVASTALGAFTELIHPTAGLSLLGVLAVGIWWIRSKYIQFRDEPDAVADREQAYGRRFGNALLVWAATAVLATLMNAATGGEFWCWPIWVAGGTWALTVKAEQWFTARPDFLAPEA